MALFEVLKFSEVQALARGGSESAAYALEDAIEVSGHVLGKLEVPRGTTFHRTWKGNVFAEVPEDLRAEWREIVIGRKPSRMPRRDGVSSSVRHVALGGKKNEEQQQDAPKAS